MRTERFTEPVRPWSAAIRFPGGWSLRRHTSINSAKPTSRKCRTDAVIAAVHDQVAAGLDVITDGEQTRYDFNLSFYGRLEGIHDYCQFRRAASGRRRTISGENTRSPERSARRTAWERWKSSSACRRSRRPARC